MKRLFLFVLLMTGLHLTSSQTLAVSATQLTPDTAVVLADRTHPLLAYAADELREFLRKTTSLDIREQQVASQPEPWCFRLEVNPSLPLTEFAVTSEPLRENRRTVRLTGHDATGVLHAVYTLLERVGITFDITGPILPSKLALDRLPGWSCRVRPDVQWRGMRLYLNFPMDLSSYSLGEAKEYLRNVARLRMNTIQFHSYSGIFYECPALKLAAGSFFYGQRHELPKRPLWRNTIRNRRTYCIPEIEPVYDRPGERSQATIQWLAELMAQAKTCGLKIQFSFEPPGTTVDDGLAASLAILTSYPHIQTLELITSENGGQPEKALARYLQIIDQLPKKLGSNGPQLAIGIYETGSGLKQGLAYLRQHSPPDLPWTFLPAHGARAVVDAVRAAEFTSPDWQRTMMYSWAEFDGLMYLQQNPIIGIRQLLDLARSALPTSQVPAMTFIHWRTAENRTAIRYAALACLNARLDPHDFYRDYARALGIANADSFAGAMNELDELDAFCRDKLFNIGFCFLGCWIAPKGLGWTRGWNKENLHAAQQRFQAIQKDLAESLRLTDTQEGRRYLRFLDNRLRCSAIHLQAIGHLLDLHGICDDAHPESLNLAGGILVKEKCHAARLLAESYLRLHAEAMPDRGCEGTLISYYHTIPAYLAHIEKVFLEENQERKPPASLSAPPAPGEPTRP